LIPDRYTQPRPQIIGATLLEVLACMAIVGILVAAAAPAVARAGKRAKHRIAVAALDHNIQVTSALAEEFDDPSITGQTEGLLP
jgi:prepilin-type N-terminal cleavage/methylation domain-containing protein